MARPSDGEQELGAAERAMLDALPTIAFVTDAAGATRYANMLYQDYTGLSSDALRAGAWAELIHPEDRGTLAEGWRAALAQGAPAVAEYRLRGADGSWRWFRGRVAPDRDGTGQLRGWVGALTDIHDLKTAEAQLARRERELRSVADAMPALVATVDAEGRYTLVNRAYETWFDRPRESMLGRRVGEFLEPGARERLGRRLEAALRGERASFEAELDYPDGRRRHVAADLIPREGEDGRPDGAHVLALDVTERRAMEAQLREREAHLSALFEQATVGIVEAGTDGRLLRVNARFCEIVGRDREALLRLRMQDLTHPEDVGPSLAPFHGAGGPGVRFEIEKRYLRPDGSTAWVRNNVTAVRDAEGRVLSVLAVVVDLSERRQAEAALRDSEEHYRHTVELSPLVSWTAQPDGMLDRVAPRWEEITGTSGLGTGWGEAIHPEDFGPSRRAWARATATGEPYDIEHRVRLRDGTYHWMHSRGFPRRNAAGRIVKWYGTTEDVEDRRAAEAAERARAEELRALLDAVPAGIWISRDAEGRQIAGNARSHEMLRLAPGANQAKGAAGTGHFRFLDAEGRELAVRDLPVQAAARGEAVAGREYRVAFDDGGHLDILGNATPLRDPLGRPAGAVAAFVDITARKAAEAQLREESRLLEALNRAGSAFAGELDPERLVQDLTDAGVALTGARFGAFFHNIMDQSGERLHLYTLSGARRADFEGLGGVRATGVFGPTFRNEGVVRSDDILRDARYGQFEPHRGMPVGHLPVRSYMAVPVASRGGEVLGGLLFGHPEPARFSERHERLLVGLAAQAAVALDNARLFQAVQRSNETLEARVAQALAERATVEEALRQSQKMDAIGQLTGGIAHDFNNLLTPILGGLDILRRRVTDERSERLLGGALQAAERAKTLVQRLLAFARRQTLQPRAVRPHDLVEGMRELIDRSLGPNIEVAIDVPATLPPVLVDPNQLELALLNLSVNARDAMPEGGRLSIGAEARATGPAGLPGGPFLRLVVGDSGVGMDADTLARAVEPFFSTKGVGRGTGLGLSMVHGLAAQSGGLFELDSRPGEGTRAVLWLPVADAEPERAAPGETVATPAPRRACILLVDDEALVRTSTAETLRDLGYDVVETEGAADALDAMRAGLGPDAVLTDHMMPGMTGAELAAEIRARRPGLPVLLMTGYANLPPEATRGLPVLAKPFRQADLAAALAEIVGPGGP